MYNTFRQRSERIALRCTRQCSGSTAILKIAEAKRGALSLDSSVME